MSENKIYIGNLSYQASEDDLRSEFGAYGNIEKVQIITDRATGRSKGFAFITFGSESEAQNALQHHEKEVAGRSVKVSIAKERTDRGGSGGRGAYG